MNLGGVRRRSGTTFEPYAYASGASAALNNARFHLRPEHRRRFSPHHKRSAPRLRSICRWAADARAVTFATPGCRVTPSVARLRRGLDHGRRCNRQGRLAADAATARLYRRRAVAAENGFLRLRGLAAGRLSGYGTQDSLASWHRRGRRRMNIHSRLERQTGIRPRRFELTTGSRRQFAVGSVAGSDFRAADQQITHRNEALPPRKACA